MPTRHSQGDRKRRHRDCLRHTQPHWESGGSWVRLCDGLVPSLICPWPPVAHLLQLVTHSRNPQSYSALSRFQPQPGRLNFLNSHELDPLLYLTATYLTFSVFDAWTTTGVFSLVSLFYVWISFGESHSRLPNSCFKNTESPRAGFSLRTTSELLCVLYKAFYKLVYFSFSPFPGPTTPTCPTRLGL